MADFIVIGAGIGGLTTALALLQHGHTVRVYEAARELREIGAGVVLGANAMRALARLGVHDAVHAAGQPLSAVSLLDQHGRVLNHVDTTPFTQRLGYDNLAIHRADLQRVLLAQLPPRVLHLGRAFERFDLAPRGVTVQLTGGAPDTADALIGADGIWSGVRGQLQPSAKPRYAGYTCWRGVTDAAPLALPANSSTETWGRQGRFGCVPVGGGRVYWFACLNSATGRNPRFQAWQLADLQRQFADYHFPIPNVLALTRPEQVLWNDILDLPPLEQFAYGRVLLLGDAAHATTPNLGQGAGQAVEDAATLADCLAQAPTPEAAFQLFEQRRRPRTTRIVRQSWQLGKAAQLTNPLLVGLRNLVMRSLPGSFNARQMRFLYESS